MHRVPVLFNFYFLFQSLVLIFLFLEFRAYFFPLSFGGSFKSLGPIFFLYSKKNLGNATGTQEKNY